MSGYGVCPSADDLRIYQYENISKSTKTTLPESYTIPKMRIPTTRNQYDINACVGFAVAEILEIFNIIEKSIQQGTDDLKLSEKEINSLRTLFSAGYIYGHHRQEGANYEGMFISQMLKYLIKHGSVPVSIFDELREMPEMRECLKDRSDLEVVAERYKIKSYASLGYDDEGNPSIDNIKDALYTYKYPILSSSDTFFGGGHCFIIIGWDDNKCIGKKYGTGCFIFLNSWGEKYGKNGISYIPYSKIERSWLLMDEITDIKFDDVEKDRWSYKSIKNVALSGLMNGVGDNKFDPEGVVTREQLATVLDRFAKQMDLRIEQVTKSLMSIIKNKD